MKRNNWRFILLGLVFLFIFIPSAEAKKKLFVSSTSSSVTVRPRLRADRRALIINFGGLGLAKSIDYFLSYQSDGVPQGVQSTLKPQGGSASRELLFGTCSKNVCRYHQNITEMRLVVTTYLKSGKKITKSFRVKP